MGTIWAQYEKRRNPFRNFEAVLVSYREYKQQLKYGAQTWNRTRDTRIFNPYIWLLFTYFTITYNYIVYITVYNIGCYI